MQPAPERLPNSGGLGADSKSGAIYCLDCDDFVYDSTFASVYSSTATVAGERLVPGMTISIH